MVRPSANRVSRREVLKSMAAVSAATIAAPFVLADDKAPAKNPILGEGEFKYECIHDWVQLPDGHEFGNASHGIALDSNHQIYITHYGKPGSIFVFDEKGKFIRAMAEQHMTKGIGNGHGVDIRKEGGEEFLYLSPSESHLAFTKMNLKGEIVWQKGREELAKDSGKYNGNARFRPTNISFSPDGGFYLGDGYGSSYIHQYDKDAKYIRTLGGSGKKDGQFATPHGNWLDVRDGTPKLAVTDRANHRLQWFDMDGNHLKTLDGFLLPADIDIRGDIMLVPDLQCRVTLLDKNDKVIVHLGEDEEWRKVVLARGSNMRGKRAEWKPGKFVHPHDAKFMRDGSILVAEWVVTGRVTLLKKLA